MPNTISLTIRLPHELNTELTAIAKSLGMTKTNLIRSAIHDILTSDEPALDFSGEFSGKRERMVLNINQLTYDILEKSCKKYNQSMNSVVVAVSIIALERSSKWLESTQP
jgi:antitoxin component of RelBE/YafQ-DinJ toxin-antitoxin module